MEAGEGGEGWEAGTATALQPQEAGPVGGGWLLSSGCPTVFFYGLTVKVISWRPSGRLQLRKRAPELGPLPYPLSVPTSVRCSFSSFSSQLESTKIFWTLRQFLECSTKG